MVDFVLTLNGIGFEDFEVPESIKAGGKQALATRKYAGGVRTIDTMGPDDAPLRWSGWFEGPDAVQRCQQLDIMRRQGAPVICQWAAYSYQVIVSNFEWDFRRFYHIGYSIELEVIQDQSYPPQQASPNVETQMQNDAASAGATASSVPSAPPVSTPANTTTNGSVTIENLDAIPVTTPTPTTPIPTTGDGWGINNP
jgi:hypothetical protein